VKGGHLHFFYAAELAGIHDAKFVICSREFIRWYDRLGLGLETVWDIDNFFTYLRAKLLFQEPAESLSDNDDGGGVSEGEPFPILGAISLGASGVGPGHSGEPCIAEIQYKRQAVKIAELLSECGAAEGRRRCDEEFRAIGIDERLGAMKETGDALRIGIGAGQGIFSIPIFCGSGLECIGDLAFGGDAAKNEVFGVGEFRI